MATLLERRTVSRQLRRSNSHTALISPLELKQVFGSLTLGGYDASRFVQHNTTFNLAEDPSRDLVVGLQGIAVKGLSTSTSSTSIDLLSQPILTFIDAGESHIWLPASACDMFSATFGLEYDSATDLYFVNDTAHDALLRANATLTFTVTDGISSTSTSKDAVTIELPYAAFDLKVTADYPGINTATYYFPIRRAANETQYTLGRTFLQQAYIIADYERSRFSLHPCRFSESAETDIRSILPQSNGSTTTSDKDDNSGHSLMPGVIAAIVIGSLTGVFLIAIVAFALGRRRGEDRRSWRVRILERFGIQSGKPGPPIRDYKLPEGEGHPEMEGDVIYRGELDGKSKHLAELVGGFQLPGELSANDSGPVSEVEGSRVVRVELPDNEVRYELDAGDVYSHEQTPGNKEGNFQRLLGRNGLGGSSSSTAK
ncbi:MAG: hypothetical protein Q9160_005569 [Pyrenula sp. 1 TL-2023]